MACLVARGCTDRDIASILGIDFATVRTPLNSALRKQGCSNQVKLATKMAAAPES